MAKYTQFRLYITKFCRSGSQVNYASMAEFYLWDENGNRLTSSVGYTTTVSSTGEGTISNMFDGRAGTIWHSSYTSSQASYTNWVKVVFDEAVEVHKYGIMPRSDNWKDFPYTFKLEASNDGENWDILDSQEELSSGWSCGVLREFDAIVTPTYLLKYLVCSSGVYYNVTDGKLTALDITNLTASVFTEFGNDDVPVSELLLTLENPEVLCWTDNEDIPKINANVIATPFSQTVITNAIDLTDETITGIEAGLADCDGELIISLSFDEKQTWVAWNGTEWAVLSENFKGMNKDTLESISFENWNLKYTGSTSLYIRIVLDDTSQVIRTVEINFSN